MSICVKKLFFPVLIIFLALAAASFTQNYSEIPDVKPPVLRTRKGEPAGFGWKLSNAAIERTRYQVVYDGSYRKIKYPGGDVPPGVGVCTDVIIRAYRQLGIDLQKDVHLDMLSAFSRYPKNWGLKRPDTNIDHRRVPNLQTFFSRKGLVLTVSTDPEDYLPGDLVTWILPGNLPHIGVVTEHFSNDAKRPLIVHNIGQGPQLEDMLFEFKITGHYRYYGQLLQRGTHAE